MSDLDIIDVDSLDFSDEQTWLYKVPNDSGQKVDIVDWSLSLDWPVYDDEDYQQTELALYSMLDEILKKQVLAMPDKHKFDSRTYVKPKKMFQRPSINSLVESNPPSLNSSANKFLTYNKYNNPLGQMLRLKTFNVEANTDNSNTVKEFAMKRRSMVQEDESQLADVDLTLISDASDRLSSEHVPSKPINIDFSQPAHNIHSTFNKGMMLSDRGSLNMYQSGESLMRMSPPSLVSSLLMESGTFNPESLDGKKSLTTNRDAIHAVSGRESIDPMMTSMTLSILDEKDMSTSFLSQSTYPDNDNLMDSLPPSLVNSVNSSYIVSTTPRNRNDSVESNNVFSSATFTHLEQSQKLLSARPRHQLYNSFKKDSPLRSSSYIKSREEGCQIDNGKVLNENIDKKDSKNEIIEAVTVHYSNNKFWKNNDAEKENLDASFEKDDAFFKDMGMQRTVDLGRNSLNITLDKQELNEIIQARQKLSIARKALPTEPLPNQVDTLPPNLRSQTVLPRKSIENASELLSRRRMNANGYDKEETKREPPKRNATFKKHSPRGSIDTTVVYVKDAKEENIIDINSATMNLIDAGEKTLQQEEWGSQERAMVGSSESTDTATLSSSSPPESVPDSTQPHPKVSVASTPLVAHKDSNNCRLDLLNLHNTISPIYNVHDHKSYTVTKAPCNFSSDNVNVNTTVINTATMVKKNAKRDILKSPEKKVSSPPSVQVKSPLKIPNTTSYTTLGPSQTSLPRKIGLPSSKFRQYSSHKELRIPSSGGGVVSGACAGAGAAPGRGAGRAMVRRSVYASNPLLSPTQPAAAAQAGLPRTDSYTIVPHAHTTETEAPAKPVLTNPPALVRQGTETLRRERPQSQMIQPKDLRSTIPSSGVPVFMRNNSKLPPPTRPYSIAVPQRVQRPSSGSGAIRQSAVPTATRPSSCTDRASALPRPSRLPAPRAHLRPPSVYSVAPAADVDQY